MKSPLLVRATRPVRLLLLPLGLSSIAGGCDAAKVAPGGASGAPAAGTAATVAGAPAANGGAQGSAAGSKSGGTAGSADTAESSAGTAAGASNGGAAGSNADGASAGSGGAASALPPHTGVWRITPLGDSITGTTCGPQLLSKALIDHGKTNFTFVGSVLNNQNCSGTPNVQTEGHGGYLVTDLVGSGQHASELPGWCTSNKADLVLMQFGTNDVWNDRSPSSILAAYATVLADLRAANPNVILLVAQITPLNPSGCDACESRVAQLNAQIPAWAASASTDASPVSVVDLHSIFAAASYTPNSTYTGDGVHPNAAGSQLIANAWYAALTALGAP